MPPFADTDDSEYSPSSTCDYTLIDVLIDTIFGCDNRNTANDDEQQPNNTSPSTSPPINQQLSTNNSEDERGSNWSGSRYYNKSNNYPQQQTNNSHQSLNKNRHKSISRSNSTGSLQTSSNSFDKSGGNTIILPHLRFNPLSGSSVSSIDDFYTLFLADDALNSFSKFHTSIGDSNITCTPWETQKDDTNCIEREIKFVTLISPGSSSNPLASNQSLSDNGTSIPLGVTIHQSLIQQPSSTPTTQQPNSNKCWKLTCNFSFDITPQTTLPKFGAYLMSSVVKGTVVTVSVTLSECDEGNIEWIDMSSINKKPGGGRNKKGSGTRRSISDSSNRRRSNSENSNDDGLLSACFSHPLLLPPEGLCSTSAYNKSSSKQGRTILNKGNYNTKQRLNIDEPAQVGASLLSAIKAKNSTDTETDVGCSYGSLAISHVFDKLPSCSEDTTLNLNKLPSKPTTKARRSKSEGYKDQEKEKDVLSSYNSRGTLKMKQMPSYEVSKSLSNISMRSMILDKKSLGNTTTATIPSAGTTPFENTSSRQSATSSSSTLKLPEPTPSSAKGVTPSTASPTSVSSKPQGLSMRIEMELNGESSSSSSTNNPQNPIPLTASLSSSFSRSTSISGIDDKVRRGLKKRIARSWITWAESWSMRLWEEEEDERSRRISLGEPAIPLESVGRIKSNVRPTVRRIGELPIKKQQGAGSTTSKGGRAKSHSPSSFQHLRTTSRRSERWMSLDNEVGEECGVEIQCTLSTTPRKTPLPMDAIEPKDVPFDEPTRKPKQGSSTSSTKVFTKNSKKRSFR